MNFSDHSRNMASSDRTCLKHSSPAHSAKTFPNISASELAMDQNGAAARV